MKRALLAMVVCSMFLGCGKEEANVVADEPSTVEPAPTSVPPVPEPIAAPAPAREAVEATETEASKEATKISPPLPTPVSASAKPTGAGKVSKNTEAEPMPVATPTPAVTPAKEEPATKHEPPTAVVPPAPAKSGKGLADYQAMVTSKVERTWRAKCASCHGKDGRGKTKQGEKMAIADMTNAAWQKRFPDAKIRKAMADGLKREKAGKSQEMKAYGDKLSAEQVDGLVAYIRTLAH